MALQYNAQFTNTQQQFAEANKISDVGIFNAATDFSYSDGAASQADMFNVFSQAYTANPQLLADYIQNAKPLISLQITADDLFTDPLDEYFNIGTNPMGGAIQVMTQDIARPENFANIGTNPYVERYNDAAAQYFTYKLDLTNYRTIKGTQLNMYFTSIESLNSFIRGTAVAIINGHRATQWFREKLMFSVAMELGMSPYDVGGAVNDLVTTIFERAYDMTFMNNKFNIQGFTRATAAERIAVILPVRTSIDIDLQLLANLFNPELVTDRKFTRIVIDAFPDVWRYSADHVITIADVQEGFVDIATQGNNQTGLQIGGTIPAGALATPHAPGAVQTFVGDTLQAWVGDRSAVMYADDLPLYTVQYPNNFTRGIQIVGHSKRSYVYSNSFNTCGIYSVAPTAASAGQALVDNGYSMGEVGVPLTINNPSTYGPNTTSVVPAAAGLNVRGTTVNPAFS